jgi:site-specific DNA-methyltransferase (adenine-specific)
MIQITNEDNMQLMARYEDNYFDLAIIDPPYGISMDGGKIGGDNAGKVKEYTKKDWDKQAPNKEYFNELIRVSKNQIIFGANHFISKIPFDSSCWIVWDKDNTGNFADSELAWTSFNTAVRNFVWRWNGMLQQNMKNKQVRIHPTEKPIQLYRWILMNYAKQGDKILDTHLGSGSIAIACHEEKFDLVACEKDTEYYNSAMKRLKEAQMQTKLF